MGADPPITKAKLILERFSEPTREGIVRAVRKLEEMDLVFEVGRQELSKGRETKVYHINFDAVQRAKDAIGGAGASKHGEMSSGDHKARQRHLAHDETPCRPLTSCQLITKTENKDYR